MQDISNSISVYLKMVIIENIQTLLFYFGIIEIVTDLHFRWQYLRPVEIQW